jgi:hypothetical protein
MASVGWAQGVSDNSVSGILYGGSAPPSTLTVDTFMSLNGATPGATMSADVGVTGAFGNVNGGDIFGPTITNPPQFVGASQGPLHSKIQVVGGDLYDTDFATQSYAYDHATPQYQTGPLLILNYQDPYSEIPYGTVAGFFIPGANDDGNAGNLFTFHGLYSGAGPYGVLQLRNGTTGCYCANIESTWQDGSTGHTPDVPLTQGAEYYSSMHLDFTPGSGGLFPGTGEPTGLIDWYLYDAVTWAQISHVQGTIKAGDLASGYFPYKIVGPVDEGDLAAPGHISYSWNIIFRNTANVSPLI